ncbi:MAG: hypothetical protein PHI97_31740 [Desulfobulbus sp.]|nr:hypothetical protein [Desulfobulbus sp.]
MGVIVLEGSHGTTKSRADSIQATGFRMEGGRRGTGAYFWCEGAYAEYLAKSWWNFGLTKKIFKDDTDKTCSVISVQLQVQEDEFIDLEDKFLKNEIADLCLKNDLDSSAKDEEISGFYDMFLSQLEKKLGKEFKVHESAVNTAGSTYFPKYPERILGPPHCYIVRDPNCIELLDISNCSE